MKKKIVLGTFIILSVAIIIFQHKISFDARDIDFLGKKINLESMSPNFYVKYFFYKNEDPIYVWNDSIFTQYTKYCHNNKLNCMIFPHQQVYTDIMWMNSIQYIGSVIDSSKARFLYPLLDNLTNLSPYWDYPYVFGSLINPIQKTNSDTSQDEKQKSWQESVQIGEKGKSFNCDLEKISKIASLSNPDFYRIIENKDNRYHELENPCTNSDLSSYLGFNYFYYLGDWQKSSDNYKIASLHTDTPSISSQMVAIVSGRGGQHITSMQIWFSRFLTLADKLGSLKSDDEVKIYENDMKESFLRSLFEYQLNILQELSQSESDKICAYNLECIKAKGSLISKIQEEISICKNYNLSKINMNSLLGKISEKDNDFQNRLKCVLLNYGIQNGLITEDNLIYPFNKPKEIFEFMRNKDISDRWVGIPLK